MTEALAVPYQASALPAPARSVLVVAPHPDDEVFGCGGAAARYTQAGARVQALILTDGGLWGVAPPGMDVVQARRQEAQRAAAVLGCEPPAFGPYTDRGLQADAGLAAFIVAQAHRMQADTVLAPSPWEVHPDHAAAAAAAIEAIGLLGGGHTLVQYEVGAPLLPNVLVDITPVWARKQQAMACFVSQLAMQRYDRHVEALNVFRTYTLPAEVQAAEAFRVATPAEARQDPFGLARCGLAHPLGRSTASRP